VSKLSYLLVISVVEGAVGYAQVGSEVVSPAVFAVTFKQCECGSKITFLQEVTNVWEF
jgi:hypothetical protein